MGVKGGTTRPGGGGRRRTVSSAPVAPVRASSLPPCLPPSLPSSLPQSLPGDRYSRLVIIGANFASTVCIEDEMYKKLGLDRGYGSGKSVSDGEDRLKLKVTIETVLERPMLLHTLKGVQSSS